MPSDITKQTSLSGILISIWEASL
ncbi:uncharacterized protein ARMOST_06243 [Armillaria ostoyae]|uniref:Uncharacterized protein n=1 Tax=Armillaria ostoyae TaxID=47428 RepID=A0A284R2H6_ARMOS|nr:uncharacterized protein ARMOST_06243 [Armillaria ostoyae]